MAEWKIEACVPVDISDDDIFDAMKDIPGYLDITPGDFKEVYVKAYQHALTRLTRSVLTASVMNPDVIFVQENTPLKEVAELMAAKKISGVPVIDENRLVLGVISEKDFLEAMGAGQADSFMMVIAQCLLGRGCLAAPNKARVAKDIMTSPAVTVAPETPILEVADILSAKKVNRAPVVDSGGRLVGIVSRADVLKSSFFPEGS